MLRVMMYAAMKKAAKMAPAAASCGAPLAEEMALNNKREPIPVAAASAKKRHDDYDSCPYWQLSRLVAHANLLLAL
jgi:hypothetical protein